MRRGIYGGSFDPVHLGHLLLAETAWEEMGLDELLFIPANRSPLKETGAATAEQRWTMLNLAVKDRMGFTTSRLELDRQPPSYTVETLHALTSQYPADEWVLILGADSLKDFAIWRSSKEIMEMASVAVGNRPGHHRELPGTLQSYRQRFTFLSGPCCELSSTEIRKRVSNGRSIRYRVPLEVEDFIRGTGLYR